MSIVKPIPLEDLSAFITIVSGAYPGLGIVSDEDRQRLHGRLESSYEDPGYGLFGLYRKDQLLGGMVLYDYTMNVRAQLIPVGGVGMLAVDILHRKEHVAKELLDFFFQHNRRQQTPLTILYPFRPDFYKKMGFGYGSKINQYRIRPDSLPRGESKAHIQYLTEADQAAVLACYNRYASNTHGMVVGYEREVSALFGNQKLHILGYRQGRAVLGYLAFSYEVNGTFLDNDLQVHVLIYDNRMVLSELLTFLRTQLDQVRCIIMNTHDDTFHYLLTDPRNGSGNLIPSINHESNVQGLGLMYRVVDVPGLFAAVGEINYGNQTCKLKITVTDSFLEDNDGSTIVHFKDGRSYLGKSQFEIAIKLDIANFSSLYMGAINFKNLYDYGLAQISDPDHLDIVDRLFRTERKPVCLTRF